MPRTAPCNRAIDHVRYQARRPAVPTSVTDVLDRLDHDDPERSVLERLGTDEAVQLIRSLPPDQAEAVMLRAVVGLDYASAAAALGKSPAAVRVAAHRGLKRLGRELGRRAHSAPSPARAAGETA